MTDFKQRVLKEDPVPILNAYFAAKGHLPDDPELVALYHEATGLPALGKDVDLYIRNTFPRP